MNDVNIPPVATDQPAEPVIDGLPLSRWTQILKTVTADPGWLAIKAMLGPEVAAAQRDLFESQDPERQYALHEAIGFLKFVNKLDEIATRARYVCERGVSPDAPYREPAV